MRFGSLFSGIGGLDLGLERAGMTCAWQVEIDEWCQAVLASHWPNVPRYGDVRDFAVGAAERAMLQVDLICGGFPCQPVSLAGKRRGQDDERWLWPEFARIVRLLRPRFVLVENVPGLLARGMGDVLGDLAASGYDTEWDCIPAAAVGAPHLRYRVFIVGHQADASRPDADGFRSHRTEVHEHGRTEQGRAELRDEQERESGSVGGTVPDANGSEPRLQPAGLAGSGGASVVADDGSEEPVADAEGEPLGSGLRPQGTGGIWGRRPSDSDWWAVEPDVGRVAHGVPTRVDRLRGLGNAVVPQVAEWVGRRILENAG